MAKSGKSLPDVKVQDGKVNKKTASKMDVNKNNCKEESVHVVTKPQKVSTPISILIESLVKNLCYVYESDNEKAAIVYKLICDKLFQMKLIDESYNMNEFEGMRSQYQKAFYHLVTTALGNDKPIPMRPAWPNCNWSSHYHHEFDEIEYIAGGGFGQVYRVKHKLDGTEYAIKKIPIRSEGIESVKNYLSEVKTFASLNHSNIVQYKAAWLELGAPNNEKVVPANLSESDYTSENLHHSIEDFDDYVFSPDIAHAVLEKKDSSDFQVDFEHTSIVTKKHYSHSIDDICMTGKPKRQKRDSVSEGGKAICKVNFQEMQELKIQNQGPIKWATLYIQMALCQTTLKQWLEKRNSAECDAKMENTALVPVNGNMRNDTITEILVQLLKGLEYIHFKGIVHHDIKPSNIFIQIENDSLLVQLGDFGLACPLQSARHSLAFGTKLYAAPEQLAGKCDPKSDMYSLGIVLLELVETFRTDMERVQTITELRKGHLPAHLPSVQPQFARTIGQLVCRNPQSRPDATTLLKLITVNASKSEHIRELELRLAEKDEEILRLKELLRSAGVKSI